MIILCTLKSERKRILTYALVNSETSGYTFIDDDFAEKHKIKLILKKQPQILEVFDGHKAESDHITHLVQADMTVQNHFKEDTCFLVMQLAHYSVVLRILWLCCHDSQICWGANTLTFNFNFCWKSCQIFITSLWVHVLLKLSAREKLKNLTHINIHSVSLQTCDAYVRRDYKIFFICVKNIDDTLTTVKNELNLKSLMLKQYHLYLNVFSLKKAEKLFPHWDYNYKIILKKNQKLLFNSLYFMF